MKTFELTDTTLKAWNTARNARPVYINFAASRMSNAVRPNTLVEFTDFRGRKFSVPVKSRKQMLKTMEIGRAHV